MRRLLLLSLPLVALGIALAPGGANARPLLCCCDPTFSSCIDSPVMRGEGGGDLCPPSHPEYMATDTDTDPDHQSCSDFVNLTTGGGSATTPAPRPLKKGWVSAIIGTELIPDTCRAGRQASPSECNLNDLLQVAVNITRLMLGVLGSLALVMFAYGGFMFLLSGGSADRVGKAKTILTNAVIGVVVVLGAWTIINFAVNILTGSQQYGVPAHVFQQPWTTPPNPVPAR